MPSARREKAKKVKPAAQPEVALAEPTSTTHRQLHGGAFGDDYARLLIALRDAPLGALLFVQLNSPTLRKNLPEQLRSDGLRRSFAVVNFAQFQPGPPPHGILREFLATHEGPLPEILFVDGLEHWVESDSQTLEALNLGRERLAALGVIVVFLLPAYVIDLIRSQALNLWTWRAHYYVLEAQEAAPQHGAMSATLNGGVTIVPGDTPEARDRRIRVLHRLFKANLSENRTLESLTHSVILPLVRELYNAGRFYEALPILERTAERAESSPDSWDKAQILSWLGGVLQEIGQYTSAEPLHKHALVISEKVLGPEHPAVAAALNNLATLYHDHEKHAQAAPLYQRALAIREKVLGPEHPDVATSLNNLAALYASQGQHTHAAPLYQRALAILEKSLGPEHPNFIEGLQNYAALLRTLRRNEEAEKLETRVSELEERRKNPT